MAIATKPKPKNTHHKKRSASHHRQTKHYVKSYWPYLPMAIVAIFGVFLNSYLNQPRAVLGAASDFSQQSLLESTNSSRIASDRSNLSLNSYLQQAAQAKADDMVTDNYWSHNTPEGDQPWVFMTNAGYQYQTAGENLAYGFDTASSITNAWMHSESHRKNLLNSDFTEVGFGIAQSPNFLDQGPETVIVALYGSPAKTEGVAQATAEPNEMTPVSRIDSMAVPALSGLAIGVASTLAFGFLLVRHGIAWRKVINRSELFIINHPLLDIVIVMVMTTAIILTNNTAGFIS